MIEMAFVGAVCLGIVLAYAVPFGILMWKTRGSTIRLEGLRFVDRETGGRIGLSQVTVSPNVEVSRIVKEGEGPQFKDYYDMSRERGGDE